MNRAHIDRTAAGHGEQGFTLIELMIVVVIIAVLATVAVVAYSRYVKNGRIVEARHMIGTIQAKQETYFQANGSYCNASGGSSCSATGDPTFHPAMSGGFGPKDWDPVGAGLGGWDKDNLGLATVDQGKTYFSYATVAGVASDNYALRGDASSLGLTAGQPWYYVEARGDMDGTSTDYTKLVVTSVKSRVKVYDEGK